MIILLIQQINHIISKDIIVNENGIFITGTTDYAPASVKQSKRTYDYYISGYSFDGSRNTDFGDNGITQIDLGDTDKAISLEIQEDGKFLIGGITLVNFGGPDARVTRVNSDGSIDSSFGDNGTTKIVSLPPSENHLNVDDRGREEASDIFIDDGNIYLSGSKYMGFVHPTYGDLSASKENTKVLFGNMTVLPVIEDFGTKTYTNGKIPD